MIIAPGYRPSKPQAGGIASGPVVERVFPYVHKLTSSAMLTYSDLRTILNDNGMASYAMEQLYIETLAVGGGGGGPSGFRYANGLLGGLPGQVVLRKYALRDILPTEDCFISLEVGSGGIGGEYGSEGGWTFITFAREPFAVYESIVAAGGPGGPSGIELDSEQTLGFDFTPDPSVPTALLRTRFEYARAYGFTGIDLSQYAKYGQVVNIPSFIGSGSTFGPGQGGAVLQRWGYDPWIGSPDIGIWPLGVSGGSSSTFEMTKSRQGGTVSSYLDSYYMLEELLATMDGKDGWQEPTDFDAFGSGGAPGFYHPDPAVVSPNRGGHGGAIGGGGGPCVFIGDEAAYQTAATSENPPVGGNGGNGGVAFRFSVLEAV